MLLRVNARKRARDMMMSHLIRRSVSTSSRKLKANVPVFSSTGDTSRMVTDLGFREKINLVMLGNPNRAEMVNYGLDTSSVEDWKAGALTGVTEVTRALARRNWDLLGSSLVTSDCLARLTLKYNYQSQAAKMTFILG